MAYTIQGKRASLNEYNTALAFEKLRIPFMFQFAPFGANGIKGQYIVDFVIQNPLFIPIEVFGEYWHRTSMKARDRLRLWVLAQYFKREVVIFWGEETETEAKALATVRREIGKAL